MLKRMFFESPIRITAFLFKAVDLSVFSLRSAYFWQYLRVIKLPFLG